MLKAEEIPGIPEDTVDVALAAFPKGNFYLTLRDELGTLFSDEDFKDLFPSRGQPALSPWRLALITLVQFRENLTDRQAAEAVRARIDLKYLLSLPIKDPGFDFSVLSEFRSRLIDQGEEDILLNKLLELFKARGYVKAGGKQRTDSTHVIANIRVLNRLELVAETLRAALNELAGRVPEWLKQVAEPEWYSRYARRIEEMRLPKKAQEREDFALIVGQDGYTLLDAIDQEAPQEIASLEIISVLRKTWERHFERLSAGDPRFKENKELPPAALGIESPYDPEARYSNKRDVKWTGYKVHLTESHDEDAPHIITHVETTTAECYDAVSTASIEKKLLAKGLAPKEHLVDSAYLGADIVLESLKERHINLLGPMKKNNSWQANTPGAFDKSQFTINWEAKQATCPKGKTSNAWSLQRNADGFEYISVKFRPSVCSACSSRSNCVRSKTAPRAIALHPTREEHEALERLRRYFQSSEGKAIYQQRAGIEGTVSQGVRGFGLRQARYKGLAKTHLQNVLTAAAMNLDRIINWFEGVPLAQTRTSKLAALAA